MNKWAFYGKGGIGKSTTVSNLAAIWAQRGLRVMQIGCDPKADSTTLLRGKEPLPTVLELIRRHGSDFPLEAMVRPGYAGVLCVEAGGPVPGLGCAGRGIIAALEKLAEKGAYDHYRPDLILYDVLGDVVCGGFAMPMRRGYADAVYILTSGENMAVHAAANIAMAVDNFRSRGYARLAGFILNRRNVRNEEEKAAELAADFNSRIIGTLDWRPEIQEAESAGKTVVELFPDSPAAQLYRALAEALLPMS